MVTEALVLEPDVGPDTLTNDGAATLHVQPVAAVKLIENDPVPPAEVNVSSVLSVTLLNAQAAFAAGVKYAHKNAAAIRLVDRK
jgi:hypothetical protein